MKCLPLLAAATLALAVAPCAPARAADHTRIVFRSAMQRMLAANTQDDQFASISARKIYDDHSGETHYTLKFFVPIFSECYVDNAWHTPPKVFCQTNWNANRAVVNARFDQIVADVTPLLPPKGPKYNDCRGWYVTAVRCFMAESPLGMLQLVIEPNNDASKVHIFMWLGNF